MRENIIKKSFFYDAKNEKHEYIVISATVNDGRNKETN